MLDGAPSYSLLQILESLHSDRIVTTEWPYQSLHLDPVENDWNSMKNLHQYSFPELGQRTSRVVARAPISSQITGHPKVTEELRNLMENMPGRCQ